MKRLAILGAVVWLAIDCQPIPPPVPPPQPDADSAAPSPVDAGDASVDAEASVDAAADIGDVRADLVIAGPPCAQFCAVLDWLGCEEGRPTPHGEPCSVVCDDVLSFTGLKLPTAAVVKCRDIACVRRAGVKCK